MSGARPAGLRLTRRGRLLLQTLPLYLLCAAGLHVVTHHDAHPADRRTTPTAASVPATAGATRPGAAPSVSPSGPATLAGTPRPAPSPSASPARAAVSGIDALAVVPGQSAVHGSGPLRRFVVEVEAGLGEDPAAFAAAVERVLFDPRGWAGRVSFQRVSSGPVAFRVTLASPRTTDRLCSPLGTGGIYSCYHAGRSVLNTMRWREGAPAYPHDLTSYRTYVVNHEVGHALGHGHRYSCGPGGLAPVMMQQTKSLYGCRQNVWPLPDER